MEKQVYLQEKLLTEGFISHCKPINLLKMKKVTMLYHGTRFCDHILHEIISSGVMMVIGVSISG